MSIESKTPASDAVRFQMMSYEKRHGEKPMCVVMSLDFSGKIWLETLPFIMKIPDAKFENPINGFRQFMGMNVVVMSETYGGSFNFGFGD